ncbi:hypothetical protein A8M32_15895 [Sinorhizobium alkalisoli]|uniref:Uncharacterized protein n=1 Tax=Sinorhizobium alkalisoli TaxID=1752398 RepID=A0A1E3V7V4_9HYPH|nr:hypothetical protein A8M32_15895 [Sinorhizobium alkalisoli]
MLMGRILRAARKARIRRCEAFHAGKVAALVLIMRCSVDGEAQQTAAIGLIHVKAKHDDVGSGNGVETQ